MTKPYRQGVFAVVLNASNDVLLIQKPSYSKHDWTIVGGGRDEGESDIDNLYREISEELGVDRANLEILGKSTIKHSYEYPAELSETLHGGKYSGQSYEIFVVRFTGNPNDMVLAEEEIASIRWTPTRELSAYLNFPNQFTNIHAAISEVLKEAQ
jgi:putative (di)nucleoside polyphosphate hydrolase